MKRISSIFTLLVLMLGLGMNAAAQTWDFASVDAADQENLNADTQNWTYESSNQRWKQQAILNNEPLKANDVELEFTKGLTFTTNAADQIRVDMKKRSLTLNNKNAQVVISNVKRGQVLTVVCQSSSSTTARTITATNVTKSSGFEESTSETTNVGTVDEDGSITIQSTGGMYVKLIKVANADDNDEETGGDDEGDDPQTPTTNDYSTSANSMKNQALLTLNDGTTKYYNTESLSSIDFDGAKVTVKPVNTNGYTFDNQVAGIAFTKADTGQQGEVTNTDGKVEITEYKGWLESAYVKFKKFEGAKTYNVYIKGGQYTDYKQIDTQLVREYEDYGRADVVGLQKDATYSIKVVPVNEEKEEMTDAANEATGLAVKGYSREGFAFMNGYVPGAYNSDGTLKANGKVMYVTKNTAAKIETDVITNNKGGTTKCTGIQAIVDAYQKGYDTTPIAFRFIGLVEKADLDGISSSEEGLQVKGKKADSELNLTFEGIGEDATVKGFGFLIRNSKSVEFRNFGIMRCMDDGLSLDTDNSNIWVHHMDFFYGPNGSGDHAKGDGSCDVKSDSKYVTVSYNRYWDTGKTNMFGMKSESGPNYISYDHNWFDHSDSRHPRVRTMSVHVWNNYFDNVAKYGVGATSGASVFVENNYFLKTKKPILSSKQGTDAQGSGTFSGENGGMIKAYGNYFDRTAKNFKYYTQKNAPTEGYDAYETATRDDQVPATEVTKQGGTSYNNFDTNASLMYTYEAVSAEDVPALVTGYYGAGRLNHGDFTYTFKDNVGSDNDDSAYDATLGGLLDNYKSSLIGIFGDENATSGEQGSDTGDDTGGDTGGDQGSETPEGTILGSFDASPSNSMFTVSGNYGDGKITYNEVYYKKGVKLQSSAGSITFTPQKDYNMTIILSNEKNGTDVKLNGTATGVAGTKNTEGNYYQMNPIKVTANTQYTITRASAEAIVMLIILEPIE